MVCSWHLQDTRWPEDSDAVKIHSLVIVINEYETCMIDYTVNALNGYKKVWDEESVQTAIDFCKPILRAMKIRGNLSIKGIEFPKTAFKV